MSHEIDEVSKGRASYASTKKEWHGLGELMVAGQSIEEWQKAAGMDYEIQKACVRYYTSAEHEQMNLETLSGKVVLLRSDTKKGLAVVSNNYKIVQPKEVLEFFRGWADAGGLTIESAGVLFEGKRYFATAKLSEGVAVGNDDRVVPYALLSTSADGTLATECRWTTVRTVCNNTLSMALRSDTNYKASHRTVFDVARAKDSVEGAREDFCAFMKATRELSMIRVNSAKAAELTARMLKLDKNDEKTGKNYGYSSIMSLFSGGGKGSQLESARGTAWGWVNACTDYVDHQARARGDSADDNKVANALWGRGDALKSNALEVALELVG
ncbi:MAG: DUF932 domain-containing protein [Candidatus Dormibacteria bacterium]